MKFGMPGRVLVVMGVMLAAMPVIALSASRSEAVAVQPPHIVDRGLENQAALRLENQAALRTVAQPSRQQVKQLQIDRTRTASGPALDDHIAPQVQAQVQEQEAEPWRSTKKGTDADVVVPTLLRLVHPKYTAEAMRANIQGNAAVEVIVSPEGDVTAARISQSLDKDLGLDGEALKAAFQWKFRPGTYQGQAVAVRVIIELEFRLH